MLIFIFIQAMQEQLKRGLIRKEMLALFGFVEMRVE